MRIEMDMSNYEIERDSKAAEYGEDATRIGWNPAAVPACQQQAFAPAGTAMPIALAAADAELFLQRMHACRHKPDGLVTRDQ